MRRFLLTSTALTLVAVTSPAFANIDLTTENGSLTINSAGNAVRSNNTNENYDGGTSTIPVNNKTITNSTLISNTSPSPTIYDKTAITYEGTSATTITANINNYYSSANRGSAISIGTSGVNLTLKDSSFINNQNQSNGGGALNNTGASTKIINSTFKSNSTKGNGGAIYDFGAIGQSKTTATIDGNTFEDNTAQTNGGAIYYAGTNKDSSLLITGNTKFSSNIATSGQGGAIFIKQGNLNFSGGTTTFSGNTANNSANDIHLETNANMDIASGATVILGGRGNSGEATSQGGISGTGNITIEGNFDIGTSQINASTVEFKDGSLTLTVKGDAENQYGKINGKITGSGTSINFVLDGVTSNGTINVLNGLTSDADIFQKLNVTTINTGDQEYTVSYSNNGNYVYNKVVALGNPIILLNASTTPPSPSGSESYNQGALTINNDKYNGKTITNVYNGVSNTLVDGNNSSAITINYDTDLQVILEGIKNNNNGTLNNSKKLTLNADSRFENNGAVNGGAIYNSSDLTVIGDTIFMNNNASQNGGAIYSGNDSSLKFDLSNGNVTMTGNQAGNIFNDIYLASNATMSVTGKGTLTIDGGINNVTKNETGSIDVNGSILKLGSNADIYTNTLSFSNATLSAADGADLFANGNINFTDTAVTLANSEINGSNLTFTGGSLALGTSTLKAANSLSFTNIGKIDATQATLNGKNISFDNAGIDIGSNELKATENISFSNNSNLFLTVLDEANYGHLTAKSITNSNGKMTVTVASNAFANDDDGIITVKILDATEPNGLTEGDFNAPIAADNNFFEIKYNDADNGSYTITKKGDPTPTPTPGGETMGIAEAWQKAGFTSAGAEEVYQHLQHVSSLKDAYTALAPTEAPVIQTALIQIQNQIIGAVSSQLTGGLSSPVSEGKSAGDGILNKVRSWVKLLVNHAKYSAHNGFSSDVQGVSMGVDKLIHEDFRLGLGYAYTNGDIDGFWRSSDLTSHTAILYGEYKPSNWYVNGIATYGWADYEEKKNLQGLLVRSKYDVDSFGLQVMTGYDFGIYTPEIGLRYARFKRDGYRDTADQYVSSDTSDILTAIMGVKFEKQFTTCGGTRWKPEARLAATYDLITDEDNALVTLNNGAAYEAKGEHLKRFGVEFGAGVNIEVNDKVDVSFGYEGHFRKDYQDHTGMVSAIYKF